MRNNNGACLALHRCEKIGGGRGLVAGTEGGGVFSSGGCRRWLQTKGSLGRWHPRTRITGEAPERTRTKKWSIRGG